MPSCLAFFILAWFFFFFLGEFNKLVLDGDALSGLDENGLDYSVPFGAKDVLHLHCLNDCQLLSDDNLISGFDGNRNNGSGHGRDEEFMGIDNFGDWHEAAQAFLKRSHDLNVELNE